MHDATPPAGVLDPSVLYELALAVGRSLDLEANCEGFLQTLLARMPFDCAAVWMRDVAMQADASPDQVSCVYACPPVHTTSCSLQDEPFRRLTGTLPLLVDAGRPGFAALAAADGVDDGAYLLYPLGEIGVLTLHAPASAVPDGLDQLRDVIATFTTSIQGCLAHQRLLNETKLELRHSEAKFSTLFQQSYDGILIHDLEGLILDVNEQAVQLFGYEANELTARTVQSLLPDDALEIIEFALENLRLDGFVPFEISFLRYDGARFTAAVSASLVDYLGDRVVQAVIRDITERKEAELEVQESLMRLFTVIETVEDGITLSDMDGRYEIFNSKMLDITGYTRDEANAPGFLLRLHPEAAGDADQRAFLENVYRGANVRNAEMTIQAKDGARKTLLVSTTMVLQKQQPRYLSAFRDITERKHAEAEIQRLKAFYEQVLEDMPIQLAVFDTEGRYLYVNPGGIRNPERRRWIIGKTDFDYCRKRGFDSTVAELRHALIEQVVRDGTTQVFEESLSSADGPRHFLRFLSPVLGPDGAVEKVLGYAMDITERKEAEETLREAKALAEQSAALKEQFLANMSHEIRTPLNAVIGMTNLLFSTELTDKQQKYLEAIGFSADALLALINDILDLSKINAGRIEFETVPFLLSDITDGLEGMLHLRAEEKGLDLIFDVDGAVPDAIVGDPTRLNQILINLIGNALKFTEDGYIRVRIARVPPLETADETCMLRFDVEDTGIGIPKDRQEGIFQTFTQAAPDTMRAYGGTGLGLAIVKQLVELQDGTIELDSTFGKGSTFSFTLPFRRASEADILPTTAGGEPSADLPDLAGAHILVVEDNAFNQMVARGILEGWGITVDVAENGRVALEQAARQPYDLILMDLRMPEMNGLEASRRIRMLDAPMSDVPILALTASALSERRTEVCEAGMDDFVTKPFVPNQLHRILAKYLRPRNGDASPRADASTTESVETSKAPLPEDASSERPLIDLAMVEANAFGKVDRVVRMIDLFLSLMPDHLATLDHARAAGDWSQVGFVVHKMKSAVGMFGAETLLTTIKAVEAHVRQGENDPDGTWDPAWLIEQVHTIITLTEAVLDAVRAVRVDYASESASR